LLVLVGLSYYQTIHEYPDGGGSYSVTKDNLAPIFSRISAAALLIDYVLTVSVSVAAGVAALVSAAPSLNGHVTEICVVFVCLVAYLNLRG
ncbi:amino acid permease, partial [Acinetobacter baumannii]